MVRKISGKSKSASYKHLNTNFNNTEAKATSKKRYSRYIRINFYEKLMKPKLL